VALIGYTDAEIGKRRIRPAWDPGRWGCLPQRSSYGIRGRRGRLSPRHHTHFDRNGFAYVLIGMLDPF
jgi:hypothetical protein